LVSNWLVTLCHRATTIALYVDRHSHIMHFRSRLPFCLAPKVFVWYQKVETKSGSVQREQVIHLAVADNKHGYFSRFPINNSRSVYLIIAERLWRKFICNWPSLSLWKIVSCFMTVSLWCTVRVWFCEYVPYLPSYCLIIFRHVL